MVRSLISKELFLGFTLQTERELWHHLNTSLGCCIANVWQELNVGIKPSLNLHCWQMCLLTGFLHGQALAWQPQPRACGTGHDETGAGSVKESALMLALRYLVRPRGKMMLFSVLISLSVDFTPGTWLLARCVQLRRNYTKCLELEAVGVHSWKQRPWCDGSATQKWKLMCFFSSNFLIR